MVKQDLSKLCTADCVLVRHKDKKVTAIKEIGTMPYPDKLTTTSTTESTEAEEMGHLHPVASTSTTQSADSVDNCVVCLRNEGHSDWIQCTRCEKWLHRNCAGLTHHTKWKAASKPLQHLSARNAKNRHSGNRLYFLAFVTGHNYGTRQVNKVCKPRSIHYIIN